MACHLLRSGWTRDEVNARLGHKPSSQVLDAYINFLALDRHKPKEKLRVARLADIEKSMEESRQREKVMSMRLRTQAEENQTLKVALQGINEEMNGLKEILRQMKNFGMHPRRA